MPALFNSFHKFACCQIPFNHCSPPSVWLASGTSSSSLTRLAPKWKPEKDINIFNIQSASSSFSTQEASKRFTGSLGSKILRWAPNSNLSIRPKIVPWRPQNSTAWQSLPTAQRWTRTAKRKHAKTNKTFEPKKQLHKDHELAKLCQFFGRTLACIALTALTGWPLSWSETMPYCSMRTARDSLYQDHQQSLRCCDRTSVLCCPSYSCSSHLLFLNRLELSDHVHRALATKKKRNCGILTDKFRTIPLHLQKSKYV